MTQKEISNLTDQELLVEAKKMKSTAIINAVLIGFVVGVVIYGVAKNNLSFFALIPLYFVYKMMNGSKNNDALKEELEVRSLN